MTLLSKAFHSIPRQFYKRKRVSELISVTRRDGKAPVVVSDVGVDDVVRPLNEFPPIQPTKLSTFYLCKINK
jgi:hypothetical protein